MNNYLTGYETLQDNFETTKRLIEHLNDSDTCKLYRDQLALLESEAFYLILEGQFSFNAASLQIPPRIFSKEELDTLYNGKNGKPYYLAASGYVFDISNLPLWQSKTFSSLERNVDPSTYFANYHQNNLIEMQKTAPIVGRFSG